jgi:hypothetical protein
MMPSQVIHRHPDGAIDFDYYRARATLLRRKASWSNSTAGPPFATAAPGSQRKWTPGDRFGKQRR